MIEPVDPLEGRVFHGVEMPPRAAVVDDFGLEQPDRRLRQSIIIGVADAADRCRDPFQNKGFRERYRRILRAGIAVKPNSA